MKNNIRHYKWQQQIQVSRNIANNDSTKNPEINDTVTAKVLNATSPWKLLILIKKSKPEL